MTRHAAIYTGLALCLLFSGVAKADPDCNTAAGGDEPRSTALYTDEAFSVCLRYIGELGPLDDWTVVDVRDPDAYHRAHATGAINMPLRNLGASRSLQSRNVVLMGDGGNDARLVRQCQRLVDRGFDNLVVLYGGIHAWHAEGGALTGSREQPATNASIRARDFFQERSQFQWQVHGLEDRAEDMKALFQGLPVYLHADSDALQEKAAPWLRGGLDRRVLLVEVPETSLSRLPVGAFHLEGGRHAYHEMQRMHVAMQGYEHRIGNEVPACAR